MTEPRDDDTRHEPHDRDFDEQVRADYLLARPLDAAARERVLTQLAETGDVAAAGGRKEPPWKTERASWMLTPCASRCCKSARRRRPAYPLLPR